MIAEKRKLFFSFLSTLLCLLLFPTYCLFCLCDVVILLSQVSGMQRSHYGVLQCAALLVRSVCVSQHLRLSSCHCAMVFEVPPSHVPPTLLLQWLHSSELQVYQLSQFASSKLLMLLSAEAPCAAAGTLSGPDANPVANRYILHDRLYQWGLSPPFSPQPPRPCPSGALASYTHLASKG